MSRTVGQSPRSENQAKAHVATLRAKLRAESQAMRARPKKRPLTPAQREVADRHSAENDAWIERRRDYFADRIARVRGLKRVLGRSLTPSELRLVLPDQEEGVAYR